jgi:predicted MPP superfamily phosphohydrolase
MTSGRLRFCRGSRYRNIKRTPQFPMRRRGFERWFLLNRAFNRMVTFGGKVFLTMLIWPRFVAPFHWRLSRHRMPLTGLDPAFAGYKILQLTDLHVGRTKEGYLRKVFARCLQEKPDLVVITGDLIDYEPESLPILRRLLEPIVKAGVPDGVAAIFGNHDYHEYSWRHVGPRSAHRAIHRRLVKMLQEMGVRLLRDEQLRVQRNGGQLVVVGMDEMWTHRADADRAFAGVSPTDAVVCLQHNPDGIEFLKAYPWQYMLCGHTHGGQARLPLLGALYVPMEHREYIRGFFHFDPVAGQRAQRRTMFVSTGLGYSAPMRMLCRPEATLFVLEPA